MILEAFSVFLMQMNKSKSATIPSSLLWLLDIKKENWMGIFLMIHFLEATPLLQL